MEKIADNLPATASMNRSTSPRSPLAWKDDWADESASLELTSSSSLPGSLLVRPQTPSTPPLQPERRLCRTSSTPVSIGTATEPASVTADHWHSSPPTPEVRVYQVGGEERRETQIHEEWELALPRGRSIALFTSTALSSSSSIVTPSVHEDEISVGTPSEDSWSVTSLTTAPAAGADRSYFISSLSDELASLKSCAKRAITLGKKVQHHAAAEVSQLRGEKAKAEATARKFVKLNHELEQQVVALREEMQKLEDERDFLQIAVQDERTQRECVEWEKDSVLRAILEEKMKMASEREAHESALWEEREKVEEMERERDAAVTALEAGTRKLDFERDAMLAAMRDLTSRVDFERDANLKSMRRSSIDICVANMFSGKKSSYHLDRQKSFRAQTEKPPLAKKHSTALSFANLLRTSSSEARLVDDVS